MKVSEGKRSRFSNGSPRLWDQKVKAIKWVKRTVRGGRGRTANEARQVHVLVSQDGIKTVDKNENLKLDNSKERESVKMFEHKAGDVVEARKSDYWIEH